MAGAPHGVAPGDGPPAAAAEGFGASADDGGPRRQTERMERDQSIAIETLALFIRYYLSTSTPVPEAHQEAARAQGKARFEQFTEQLGRHLMRGRSLVRDVMEELHPDPVRMEDAAVAAPGAGACVMSAIPQLPPEPRSSAAASLDRRIQMLRTAMGPHRRRRGTDYLVGRGH